MTPTLERKTRRAFFFVLFTPLLLGLIVGLELHAYQQSVDWVAHTNQVLSKIQEMLLAITRAESAQRGYLLSGEQRYLYWFSKAKTDVGNQLASVRELTMDNPAQQESLGSLKESVTGRLNALETSIEKRRTGQIPPSQAGEWLRDGTARMQEIWNTAHQVTARENSLLRARTNGERDMEIAVGVSFAVCILVNVGILFLAYRTIVEYSRARELAADQILRLNAELEQRVLERTSELELVNSSLKKSNDDLTKFAYIASHDLQEPLRTIGSYVGLLSLRYQGKLDEQADRYIRFVVDGAKRMQNLVQDLLIYSRVGTDSLKLRTVNLNDVLQNVRDNLNLLIREQEATIVSDALPTLVADESKLTQVFMNLIGNGIKFRKPDEAPHITIDVRRLNTEWQFSVSDNGIGFDQQYAERIFAIFQRLHGVGAYPGTGMGLAICKRIIEQHGGSIAATSAPGAGSCFTFTLLADAQLRALIKEQNEKDDKMSSEAVST